MKKKGFTLIELLAVIVILAIVALILIPIVSNVVDSSRKAAFKESVNGIIDSTNNYVSEYVLAHKDDMVYPVTIECDGVSCKDSDGNLLTFKGTVPISGSFILREDSVLAEYVTDGKYCAYGYKWDMKVGKGCNAVDSTKPIIRGTLEGQTIHIVMTDNESGIYGYCVTKDDNCNYNKSNDNVDHELSEHGLYKVYAKDKKGNISEPIIINAPEENFKPEIAADLIGKVISMEFTPKFTTDSYCINTSNTTNGCVWHSTEENNASYTLSSAGTYYAFIKNKKNYISNSVSVVAPQEAFCSFTTRDFGYTGGVQAFTIPTGCTGTFKLEVWGAQGGTGGGYGGGYGGYASGNVDLTAGQTLYIAVGGAGSSTGGGWNGGGSGKAGAWDGPIYLAYGGGGGATHIGKTSNLLRDIAVSNIYIVAGGGGGGYDKGVLSEWTSEREVHRGGYAGGSGSGGGTRGSASANCGSGYSSGVNGGGGTNYKGGVYGGESSAGARAGHGLARITYIQMGYTVTFNANGGSVNPATKTVYANNPVVGDMPIPTNGDKMFLGWYTDTAFTSIAYTTTPVYDDMTLYARWMDGSSVDFSYTGKIVGIRVPKTGTYKLEVWGGAGGATQDHGGGVAYYGGAGGYASGNATLTAGEYIYVAIGGAGATGGITKAGEDTYSQYCHSVAGGFNGGGAGNWGCFNLGMGVGGGGGGGATHIGKNNATLANTNISNVYIAAAGGGGGGVKSGWTNEGEGYRNGSNGAAGGGATGGTSAFHDMPWGASSGTGATQSSGAAYGQGGSGSGGGGGGYYGGTGGHALGGGGGSCYLGGVTGGTTQAGVRSGSGYAKITFIG